MPLAYAEAIRTARMQAVLDALTAGPGTPALQILDAGDVLLASIPLDGANAAAAGALTFGAPSTATASGTGTAAKARIRDADGVDAVTGLVCGLVAGDDVIVLDDLSIVTGRLMDMAPLTISD